MSTNATIHLQSIGAVPAKPAGELTVGDRIMWNFGYVSTVTDVIDITPAFVLVIMTSNGVSHTRRMKKTRLVAA